MNKSIHKKFPFSIIMVLMIMTGCSGRSESAPEASHSNPFQGNEQEAESTQDQDGSSAAADSLSESCRDIFEEAARSKTADTLEIISRLVARIGESGYPAVDCQNQVNMVNSDQAVSFCRQAEEGKNAELTIFTAEYTGGVTKYNLQAEAGELSVAKSYYHYENGKLNQKSTYTYPADFWQYTDEGYLLFRGSYFMQDYYVYTLSDVSACTALRVEPLDETCREMNRKYILPIGYGRNNLFLEDWSESDFGGLDFYDLFDKCYPWVHGEEVPYKMDDNLGTGAVYRIPEEEFAQVICPYLQISLEMLRSKTTYFPEDHTYEYKPRGLHEAESGDVPYPEVVDCKNNPDGTVTLTVNAVFLRKDTSRAFAHEVVIRPLEGDGFQYISNRIIPSPDNCEPTWRRARLTEEQWKELYSH